MGLTNADKAGNTKAWQDRDKKNVKTGEPLYKMADHLRTEGVVKKELKALCEFISYNNDIDKELDAIYDKLGGISNACTCKEDSNVN